MSINSHLANALRYIEAVYDVSVAKASNDEEAQSMIEKFLIKQSDDKLVNYIHQYRLETSAAYKQHFLENLGWQIIQIPITLWDSSILTASRTTPIGEIQSTTDLLKKLLLS